MVITQDLVTKPPGVKQSRQGSLPYSFPDFASLAIENGVPRSCLEPRGPVLAEPGGVTMGASCSYGDPWESPSSAPGRPFRDTRPPGHRKIYLQIFAASAFFSPYTPLGFYWGNNHFSAVQRSLFNSGVNAMLLIETSKLDASF